MRALVGCLRRDRLLAIATVLSACLVLWPLTRTDFLPLMDLPHHVALAAVLGDLVLGKAPATTFYELNVTTPYWTLYVLLALFTRIFGVFIGTKLVVGLGVLLVPLGAMRLLIALGRSPAAGLAAFLLSWDFSVYYGWINFVLGVGLGLFALARLVEAETPRAALRCWPLVVLVGATHGLALAFLGAMGGLAALLARRRLRAIGLAALALAPPAAVVVPWLLGAASQTASSSVPTRMSFDPLTVKARDLFADSVGAGLTSAGAGDAQAAAFLTLLIFPVVLGVIRQDRRAGGRRAAIAPLAAALVAYLGLPLAVAGQVEHWGDYPRFASMIFVGLLFLPRPSLRGSARLVLAPVLIVLAWLGVETGRGFAKVDAELAPLRAIVRLVPAGASLLPLAFDTRVQPADHPIGEAILSYVTANNRGFNPYLFHYPTNLVHYREEARLPSPPGWGRSPHAYDPIEHAQHYDYILVEGLASDPVREGELPNGKRIVRVAQRRRFRLYKIE
jgi:hypothetical protein